MVGRVIEFVRHCWFLAFQVDGTFSRTQLLGSGFYPYLDVVVSFVVSLYYFIGILFTLLQWQKRVNFLTFQAEEPLCHLYALWLLDKKAMAQISKATLG